MTPTVILALIVIAVGAVVLYRSVRIVPQATADIVERFGRYHRTLNAGLSMVVPFVDQIRAHVDLREQVLSFPPQSMITQENLEVDIDTVIYFHVTDPKAATYEVASYLSAIEQLTMTTLRNIIGGMDLERTLTSRDEINTELREVLDDVTGNWGIRVKRVEIKAIDPPDTIKDAMEKQTRADRDKRASILTAEGQKQAAILNAEGERTSAVLRARGDAEAAVLRAEADAKAQAARARGEAQAIATVFKAIHEGKPDQRLLAFQYLQTLPKIAEGESNTVWIVPSEISKALEGLGGFFGNIRGDARDTEAPHRSETTSLFKDTSFSSIYGDQPSDTPSTEPPTSYGEHRSSASYGEQPVPFSEPPASYTEPSTPYTEPPVSSKEPTANSEDQPSTYGDKDLPYGDTPGAPGDDETYRPFSP